MLYVGMFCMLAVWGCIASVVDLCLCMCFNRVGFEDLHVCVYACRWCMFVGFAGL